MIIINATKQSISMPPQASSVKKIDPEPEKVYG
jgi:hypothetical protein